MCVSSKRKKQAWPTKDAMAQVYEKSLWGGSNHAYFSGEGSHDPSLVAPYIKVVSEFLAGFDAKLRICDLGCGDFNIGKELLPFASKYIAVDIVDALIAYNKDEYQEEKLEFHCLDIAKDVLPKGDLALVRQVLQHISNAEVQQVLDKLKAYKYVLLTEHIPNGKFEPNKDIISGQGIRLKKKSGLQITMAPFNLKVIEEHVLSRLALEPGKGVIGTTLYTVY